MVSSKRNADYRLLATPMVVVIVSIINVKRLCFEFNTLKKP